MSSRRQKVTLDDIAKEVSLSKYVVSRAISGKSGVSEKSKEKVLLACKKLGYEKKTSIADDHKYVIFVIPEVDAQDTSFWMRVMLGIENSLTSRRYGLHVLITTQIDENILAKEVSEASGIIFGGFMSLPYVDKIAPFHRPMLIMTYPPSNLYPYDAIHFADREGAFALAEHLIKQGHNRIAYFGSINRPSMKKRFDGLCEAAKLYNAEITNIWDDSKYNGNQESIINEIKRLHEENRLPSLIICSTDAYAQSLIFQLSKMGISVPDEVSVTGFNSDLGEPTPIPLTSIGFNKKEYGRIAVHYLMDRLDNPSLPAKRIAIVPKLIEGKTTRPLIG